MVVGRGFKVLPADFEARFADHDAIKFREVSSSDPITLVWPCTIIACDADCNAIDLQAKHPKEQWRGPPHDRPRRFDLRLPFDLLAAAALQDVEHRSVPSVLGVFFLLTEETEIQAKYEQNEVNDGALAADVGCLNRNGPCVRQHNGK